ncbi:hypothetical protein ACXYTJ_00915 [Gilvimarinus sp. F26214L]|uniref:hypothetical protein n=1 Tax=Gilvimarinus sp. DZF01 TaxID=3461371 RepID=UPI0040462BFD
MTREEGASTPQSSLSEQKESLWLLVISPTIWALHFVLSYVTAAIWCAKSVEHSGPLGTARTAVAIYTLVAALGVTAVAWRGLRKMRRGAITPPFDDDSPLERHQFLGWATVLLSGLSLVAIVYAGLGALFIETCW